MNNENYAVIDLTIDSKDFKEENIIHKNEFEQAKKLIQEQIPKNLQDITKNGDFEGYYKTILVEGGRGTGKTTFLKNFFNKNITETSLKDIEILPFLDPTRIENKTSIFLTIVSLIRECIYNKFGEKINECGIECKRKSWDDILNKLAKGLPSIDDNHKEPYYWDDDFMIMEKGLSATKSAFDLRKNFKILIKESLELLGKKSFLLIVDDVDTDYNKAWRLLETLRKYLCVQGFVTVVSGNLELFSLEIRLEQSKRFKELSADNKEKQIIELTDQYIRKIFPPAYRISLDSLNYLVLKGKKSIFSYNKPEILIKYSIENTEINLLDFIKAVFNTLGIRNDYQITAYIDFIFSLPLRSQIDFYRMFQRFATGNSKIFPLDVRDIAKIFSEDLIQYHIDENLIAERPYIICCVIFDFLSNCKDKKDIFADYYQLQPVALERSLNSALFVLGMVLSILMYTNPELIFNYMIRIGFVRNFAQLVKNNKTNNYDFSLSDMANYAALDSDIDLRHTMCVMTAYLRSATTNIPGIFKITKENKEKLFNQKNKSIGSYIAQLPYSCSRNFKTQNGKNKDNHEYSIYNLISSIFDIVRATEAGESFEEILRKNCQPREYLMVSDDSSSSETNSRESTEKNSEIIGLADIENISSFEDEINQWMNFIKRLGKYIQPYVLAKITTRMYYAFSNVPDKKNLVHEKMQEYILLMFNSVIIEELAEYNPLNKMFEENKVKINRENSATVFYENLKAISSIFVEDIPLCEIFITCPFFLFFIDFSNPKNQVIENFCEKVATHTNLSRYSTGKLNLDFYKDNSYALLKKLFENTSKNDKKEKSDSEKKSDSEEKLNSETKSNSEKNQASLK